MLSNLAEAEKDISSYKIENRNDLENFRIKFISRKGLLSRFFDELKNLSGDEKPLAGKKLNELKALSEKRYGELKRKFDEEESGKTEDTDLTLPGRIFSTGRKHVVLQTLDDFVKIFSQIGFRIAEGPEVEEDFYNFDALNTPEYHPARDLQDTFYIVNRSDLANPRKYLLRTHTSPVQIRTMLKYKPPIRIVSPGKVFRNETVTVKNYFMFHQVEGLYVDKNVNMGDLKGVLSYFVRKYYGEDIRTRFIPSYFPFTEPSAQLDINCFICRGKGCRTCKNTGWLEVGGCGMVDPNVFKAVGYDPEVYSGYAFGMGIERIAMMKYGINDIRLFYQNDIRFLDQF